MRKLVYFIGTTIDGFIAAPDGDLAFFPLTDDVVTFLSSEYPETLPVQVREQLGIADAANRRFGTVIQGRATYAPAIEAGLTSPYPHLRQYVVSETLTPSPDPAVTIISGDVTGKVRALKAEEGTEKGRDIFLLGGARLAGSLLPEIDELVVKIYPVVAGAGIPMFGTGFSPLSFRLTGTRTLDGGMALLSYER
ncbi:dihydrofolate reductase family protein [Actinomadura rudentiformis]|uniref:Dihydrofolate reductase n=1 Tax=Actinomadura rudentiformis TaxID=359158 RepID=A0A6H9YZL2_9ACTN|nr:dihydrofolate reductase family protein [Actinomadura rudentiformis]KAB2348309.1 dihydrofolate reductase [Actinomadura rudentiformis]